MSHYSNPVKSGISLVSFRVTFSGDTQIHAVDCRHSCRAKSEVREHSLVDCKPFEDFYVVAPCAKDGKGFVCDKGGCSVCS